MGCMGTLRTLIGDNKLIWQALGRYTSLHLTVKHTLVYAIRYIHGNLSFTNSSDVHKFKSVNGLGIFPEANRNST